MSNTIEQYREAKATYEKLHNQARKELIARFNQLSAELLLIQRELKDDFGHKVSIPLKGKAVVRPKQVAAVLPNLRPAALPNPRLTAIEKRIVVNRAKLEKAVAAGKPDKAIQDRTYELEDELRLAKEN